MAEPERDDGGVDSGLEECHGAAVAQGVGVEPFVAQRRAPVGGHIGVFADQSLDSV